MYWRKWICGGLSVLAACVGLTSLAAAQAPATPAPAGPAAGPATTETPSATPATRPVYRIAEHIELLAPNAETAKLQAGDPNEHPLMPALRWARDGVVNVEKLQDYSATVVKRERISGKLGDQQFMSAKVRHKPFSVYLKFDSPASLKGREVIYVEGANNGKMWAHSTGIEQTMFHTVSLRPDGPLAMRDQRYPVTELGILNLTHRLIEVAEQDIKYGECEVKFFKGAKINDRVCTCTQVIHPVPRRNFLFHIARIFVDDELNLPIHYEAYDWPKKAGGAPELLEQYTYLNLKLNAGLTNDDFDIHNSKYGFSR
ncbi:MAG: DUF1571 domain-containing protein [Thermoguttaceae bacterium]|jgi:hypothetical protein